MSLSSSVWSADVVVTASNPYPGRATQTPYLQASGTGFVEKYVTKTDDGVGLNVYIAGGSGPQGVIPVSQTNPTQISLSGVTIGGVIEITTSLGHPIDVTGSVYILNPSPPVTSVTATIPGIVAVSQTNLPATQSVIVTGGPLGVTGTVGVVGTASVRLESVSGSIPVTGAVAVSGPVTVANTGVYVQNFPVQLTGVDVQNWPVTQSVYVVNQTSGTVQISGVVATSQTNPVLTASVSVSNFPATTQVSGATFQSGALVVTGVLTVANEMSGTVTVTGTVAVSNLPATQSVYVVNQSSGSSSGDVNITSSITLPVSMTNPVLTASVSVSNFPVQTTGVFVQNLPATQSVYVVNQGTSSFAGDVNITSSITLPVSMTNPVLTASVSVSNFPVQTTGVFVQNLPATQSITGTVHLESTGVFVQNWPAAVTGVAVTNLPTTQSVFVVNQTSGSVTVSGTASVQVTNFPAVVTVSGTGAFGVTVLNPVTSVTATITGVLAVSQTNLPATQSVFVVNQGTSSFAGDVRITASITLPISQTNPVLTASVSVSNFPVQTTGVFVQNLPATQSVYVVNQSSASLGTVEISGVTAVSGYLPVTGNLTVNLSGVSFSASSDVNINGTTAGNNYSFVFPTGTEMLTLLSANPNRKNFTIFNDSTENLLVRLGPSASYTTWTFNLYVQHFYEPTAQVWKGDVTCYPAGVSGSGAIQVEEFFL